MSTIPDDLINSVIAREGGYVNNPADRGGETNFGITAATARAFGYQGSMQEMSQAMAAQIYKQRYWTAPKLDQVAAIDSSLAAKLLDIGVNMGPATGVKFMQRALNVLNQQATTYPDITVDGGIGPMTIAALQAFYATRGDAGRGVLLGMIIAQQSVRYIELAEQNPSQEVFEYGWQLNRAFGSAS
ncbi:glycoside hydrolase family 108 protein [Burkholderia gladioli]|uniref:glycoside hydrolase family 108 protein n=1 Tax=Burkholderia gladioli TaxID=28095 RepID=UPI00163F97D1|nr:glycosyl hydrolase 108 family protein [Burkholderia gladioli]